MIFLDLETTGLDPIQDQILEFSAVKTDADFQEIARLDFLLNPETEIPPLVSYITNIKPDDVKDAQTLEDKKTEIQEFLKDEIIVGHNISFDLGFLKEKGIIKDMPSIDTGDLALIAFPTSPSYALEVLSDLLEIEHEHKHRALGDVLACLGLMKKCQANIASFPEQFFNDLEKYQENNQEKSSEPIIDWILSLKDKKTDPASLKTYKPRSFNQELALPNSNEIISSGELELVLSEFIKSPGIVFTSRENLEKFRRITRDSVEVLESKKGYLDSDKLKNFLDNHEVKSPDHALLLVKILRNLSLDKKLNFEGLNIHRKDRNLFYLLTNDNAEKIQLENKTYLAHFSLLFKSELEIPEDLPMMFFRLDENELDANFSGLVSEKFLMSEINDNTLKVEFSEFFSQIKDSFTYDELGEYGQQFMWAESSLYLIDEIYEKGLKLADMLAKQVPALKKTAINMHQFFTSKPAIRYVYLNSNLEIHLNVSPLKYQEITQKFFNKNTKLIDYSLPGPSMNTYHDFLYPSDLQVSNQRNYIADCVFPDSNFPGAKHPKYTQALKAKLTDLFNSEEGRIIILSNSKKQLQDLMLYFALESGIEKEFFASVNTGSSKIMHKLRTQDDFVFFCHYNFVDNLILENIEFSNLVVSKLPFDGPQIIYRSRDALFESSFQEYTLTKAYLKLKKSVRIINAPKIHFLEGSIKNRWANIFKEI